MAITTYRNTVAAGFARTASLDLLEGGFAWLGWHGGTMTGVVTGITTYSGGGVVVSSAGTDQTSCYVNETGAGSAHTCSFYVERLSGTGAVEKVYVQRGGHGYTNGQTVTIPAFQMGGTGIGASDMTVQVQTTNVSYGTTLTWYDKETDPAIDYPWSVMRKTIASNKAYGDTYYGFQMSDDDTMRILSGSSFFPWDAARSTENMSPGYGNRFAGANFMDTSDSGAPDGCPTFDDHNGVNQLSSHNIIGGSTGIYLDVTGSNVFDLDINIFRSSLDPRFAVFAFNQPTRPSTSISDNTYACFFLHDFDSTLWDYDNVFLGGYTELLRHPSGGSGTAQNPEIEFRTYFAPYYNHNTTEQGAQRCAELGFAHLPSNGYQSNTYVGFEYAHTLYGSWTQYSGSYNDPHFYYYDKTARYPKGAPRPDSVAPSDNLPDSVNYNAIWNGIPLQTQFIPCPYYLPDDFALISFEYGLPDQDIQMWDTITVSGSEIYTIICSSYRNDTDTGKTIGIAFCARTT